MPSHPISIDCGVVTVPFEKVFKVGSFQFPLLKASLFILDISIVSCNDSGFVSVASMSPYRSKLPWNMHAHTPYGWDGLFCTLATGRRLLATRAGSCFTPWLYGGIVLVVQEIWFIGT